MPAPWAAGFLVTFVSLAIVASPSPLRSQLDTPLIDTRSASTGSVLERDVLEEIPSARDPWSLLATLPQVQPAGDGRPTLLEDTGNLITIDGVAIDDGAALGGGSTVDWDFIDEIPVQTGGNSALFGDPAGGVIRVVTKSGTNEWAGTGRYLLGKGDPNGFGALTNPGIRIDVTQDAAGGYCLDGFQVLEGGMPIPGGGGGGPIRFGFDNSFTIGVGPGSGTTFGAGASGNLNLSRIPGCPGQPFGMSFVDTPAPVTPPTPTHLAFGRNGVFAVDMGRIGQNYGLGLGDTHVFGSSFYLNGTAGYANGRFQPQVGRDAAGRDALAAGTMPQGMFLYGLDAKGLDSGWTPQFGATWDRYAIRIGDAPTRAPDADGDGSPDTYFLSLATLAPGCANGIGGAFTPGAGGSGGGSLEPDAGAAGPDCEWLQDRARIGDYLSLNLGVRYETGEPASDASYESPFSDMVGAGSNPVLGGAFGTDARDSDLGGPIIKDRLWIWGSYAVPERKAPEPEAEAPLFSESWYSRVEYAPRFGAFTQSSVESASSGRGVQDIGLEIRYRPVENGHAPIAPGGAAQGDMASEPAPGEDWLRGLAEALDSPLMYVVASGGPTGDVFEVQVVHPESGPVAIDGLVAVEPVAATAEDRERFERELAGAGGLRETVTAAGYCLNQDLLAPPAGTVYRVAPAAKQAAFAPIRRALDAARRLRDAGQLNPDSAPTDYYHAIRQWAVWTIEKKLDREGFLAAFVERTEENFRAAGQPWSADVAATVRSFGEGRWTDIRKILDAAGSSS